MSCQVSPLQEEASSKKSISSSNAENLRVGCEVEKLGRNEIKLSYFKLVAHPTVLESFKTDALLKDLRRVDQLSSRVRIFDASEAKLSSRLLNIDKRNHRQVNKSHSLT